MRFIRHFMLGAVLFAASFQGTWAQDKPSVISKAWQLQYDIDKDTHMPNFHTERIS